MRIMSDLDDAIERSVRALVADLYSLIKEAALQSVRDALAAGQSRHVGRRSAWAPSLTAGPERASQARLERIPPADGKRSEATRQRIMAVLLQFIRDNPGSRMEHIAKALRTNREALRRPMARLLAGGAVRRTGWSRGAKYFEGRHRSS